MRTHELVLDWIEAELDAGRLRLGERLPPERALAEQLAVSRTSVREAIRVLEAMGLVRSGVGSGPDAGTVVTADAAAALGSVLRLHIATSHLPVDDIVQTRILLEAWAVSHARPDSEAMVRAGDLLRRMEDPQMGPDEFLHLDAEFHLALAEAAGNALLSILMASLRESIEGYTRNLTSTLPHWPQTMDRLRGEHRAIHETVLRGEGSEASRLVTGHIEGYYREAGHRA